MKVLLKKNFYNFIVSGIDLGDDVGKWLSEIILEKPEGNYSMFYYTDVLFILFWYFLKSSDANSFILRKWIPCWTVYYSLLHSRHVQINS